MYKLFQIFQLISFNFFSILIAIVAGKIFLMLLRIKIFTISIFEQGLVGLTFIGFLSIFVNFFFSLNQFINSILTISFFLILIIKSNIKFILNNIKSIFLLSLFSSLLLIFSTVYAPDGSIYHIPYIKLLNDEKIIIGASNINFRFGLNSIVQYISAFYNNYLFGEIGITIPLVLIISFFIFFLYFEIDNKFNSKGNYNIFYIIILFFFLISSIYQFSRYSEYGNDDPGHVYYFYLICLVLNYKNYKDKNLIFLIFTISIFLIANKLFFILSFIFPLYFLILNQDYNFFKNKLFMLIIFLFLIVILKNLMISGCFFYPVKEFCINSFDWTNINEVSLQSLEGEAWAKGWINQNIIIDFKEYSNNFNWLSAWFNVHFKVIIRKFLPIIIFITSFFFILIFFNLNFVKKKNIKVKFTNHTYFIFIISIINFIFWFYKFPLYRYGYSFIAVFFIITSCIIFFSIFNKISFFYLRRIMLVILILSFTGVITKNFQRILNNYNKNYFYYPWPNLLSLRLDNNYSSLVKIKVGESYYYYSKDGGCMYLESPCSNYLKKDLLYKKVATYKVYYSDKF